MSAQFPTEAPTLYESKTTANDVSDTAHWDGADANAVKDEVLAIAAKVGIDGDTNESSHDYKLAALDSRVTAVESRMAVTVGSGTLAASTSTVVSDANATAGSTIVVQPKSSAFTALGVYVSAKGAGSFTLTHATAAGTETFDYIVVN